MPDAPLASADARLVTVRDAASVLRTASLAYVVLAVALTGLVALAAGLAGAMPLLGVPGRDIVGGWCRFDCTWYVDIAQNGYSYVAGRQSSVAFFPGYALIVRAIDQVVGNIVLSAVLVTWCAGLGAVVLFTRWSLDRLGARMAVGAVAALLLYPYGWFLFGAGYADALFVLLVVAAFLLVERDHFLLAGIVGAFAGVTRPTGIAVVGGLLLVAFDRAGGLPGRTGAGLLARLGVPARIAVGRLRLPHAWLLVALAGPIAFSVWLADRFGDPFVFVTVQEAWDQTEGPHTWFKVGFAGQVLHGADPWYSFGLVLQALLTLAALLAIPAVIRRFGAGYGGYTLVIVVLAALGTKDFQGMGRYLLGAFPLFALVGSTLADPASARVRRARVPIAVSAALLLGLGAFGFGRGWYLT